MKPGLIDEFRVWVNPIILGGKPLFGALICRRKLKLIETKTFWSLKSLQTLCPVEDRLLSLVGCLQIGQAHAYQANLLARSFELAE
jgi:hypothetical protein